DPAAPPQPFRVVEAKLGPLEGPLIPGGVGERRAEVGSCLGRVGEDAAGAGDELLEPGRGPSVEAAECALDDVAPFDPPVGADRGGGEIGHPQVGGVVVQRRAVLAEQPAELGERLEVAAVGESRDAEGTPGPGGHQPAFGRIDGGERPARVPAGRAGVAAHSQDGGGDHVSGRRNDVHLVRLGHAGGLGGDVQRLVPAPGVDVGPPERGQGWTAGALRAGCPEPLHGILQQADRQVGFVQEERGGNVHHNDGSSRGEPAIVRRYGTSWFLLPTGSVLARIPSFSALTCTRGPWPGGGGPWRSRRSRVRLTASRLPGLPDWYETVAALARASQARAGWSRDASSATEM